MTEMIERVARAIDPVAFDAMWHEEGTCEDCDAHRHEARRRAGIALDVAGVAEAVEAFTKIRDFTDREMGDGDGARHVAEAWLEKYATGISRDNAP